MPYPNELDELEQIVDRSLAGGVWTPGTKWQAAVVNPWIDAINAIQETLGISPQGASDTVSERISVLEAGQGMNWIGMEYVADGDDMTTRFALDHTPIAGTCVVWVQKEMRIQGANPAEDEYYVDGGDIVFYAPPTLDHPIYAHYAYIPVV